MTRISFAARARSQQLDVHGLMIVATILIGTSFVVGREIAAGLDPAVLMAMRFAMAVVLYAPFVAWKHGLTLPSLRDFARYAIIASAMVGYFWCMFEALRYTSAFNTGAINTTVPGLAAIFSVWIVRERIGTHRLVALAIAGVGALWVIFRGDIDRLIAFDLNKGDMIFFAGCISLGFYTPFIQKFNRGEPAPVITFWVLVCGFLWMAAISNVKLWTSDWANVDLAVYGGAAYLALFTTIITYTIYQWGTPKIGATRAIAYSYFYPAVVMVLVWITGQESPPLMAIPGVVIVMVASVVVQQGAKRKVSTPTQSAAD